MSPFRHLVVLALVCAHAVQILPGAFRVVLCQDAGGTTHIERSAGECCRDTAAWSDSSQDQLRPGAGSVGGGCEAGACTDTLISQVLITLRGQHAISGGDHSTKMTAVPVRTLVTTDPLLMLTCVQQCRFEIEPPGEPLCGLSSTVLNL